MRCRLALLILLLVLFAGVSAAGQDAGNILVVTANSGDYLFGAGGTLIKFVQEGL